MLISYFDDFRKSMINSMCYRKQVPHFLTIFLAINSFMTSLVPP